MSEKVKFPHLTKEAFEQAYWEARERVDECYRDDPYAVFAEIVAEERAREQAREIIEKSHQERSNENDQ